MKKNFNTLFFISIFLLILKAISLDNYELKTLSKGFYEYIATLFSLITLFTVLFGMKHNQDQFSYIIKKDKLELTALLIPNISTQGRAITVEVWNLGKSPAYGVDVLLHATRLVSSGEIASTHKSSEKHETVIPPLGSKTYNFLIFQNETPKSVDLHYYDIANPKSNDSKPLNIQISIEQSNFQ